MVFLGLVFVVLMLQAAADADDDDASCRLQQVQVLQNSDIFCLNFARRSNANPVMMMAMTTRYTMCVFLFNSV